MQHPQTTIIYGGSGSGKTVLAETFRLRFGCTEIVDDWNGVSDVPAGALVLLLARSEFRAREKILVMPPGAQVIGIKDAAFLTLKHWAIGLHSLNEGEQWPAMTGLRNGAQS